MFSYSYLKLQVYLQQTIVNQSNLPISSAPGGDNETGINRGVFRIRIFSVFFTRDALSQIWVEGKKWCIDGMYPLVI